MAKYSFNRRAFLPLSLAASTFVSCGEGQYSGVSVAAAPHHLAQPVNLSLGPLEVLQTTSNLLDVLALGNSGSPDEAREQHALHSQYIGRFWQAWHRDALGSMQNAAEAQEHLGDPQDVLKREMQLLGALFQDPMPQVSARRNALIGALAAQCLEENL